MISLPELRKISRERKLALDLIEKDYAIGWILEENGCRIRAKLK